MQGDSRWKEKHMDLWRAESEPRFFTSLDVNAEPNKPQKREGDWPDSIFSVYLTISSA